jgi:hypothetical protein
LVCLYIRDDSDTYRVTEYRLYIINLIHISLRVMRFVIPVEFYEITNVQRVYRSNTTIFIGRIESIFYIRYNYMFRRLIMAIIRLYTKYLISSYTKHTWDVYMG